MNIILLQNRYPLVNIAGSDKSRINYYKALEKCQAGASCKHYLQLVAKAELTSITNYSGILRIGYA